MINIKSLIFLTCNLLFSGGRQRNSSDAIVTCMAEMAVEMRVNDSTALFCRNL